MLSFAFLLNRCTIGPVFRTDDLMQLFRNAVIPGSSGARPRSPPPPSRPSEFFQKQPLYKIPIQHLQHDLRQITDPIEDLAVGGEEGTSYFTHIKYTIYVSWNLSIHVCDAAILYSTPLEISKLFLFLNDFAVLFLHVIQACPSRVTRVSR